MHRKEWILAFTALVFTPLISAPVFTPISPVYADEATDTDETNDRLKNLTPLDEIIPKEERDSIDASRELNSIDALDNDDSLQSLPQKSDLRWRDTEVQKQIGGTCTSFGLTAAMENLLLGKVKLSENHLWSLYRQYQALPALRAAYKHSITLQKYWPIKNRRPSDGYRQHAHYKLTSAESLKNSISNAVKALANGQPVYLAFRVPMDVARCKAWPNPASFATNGGHAVEISGYDLKERRFIIKNSWGKSCGDRGYQYLPFEYCTRPDMYCSMWAIKGVGQ